MSQQEIPAGYDERRVAVLQAYRREIATAAVQTVRFVPPFSLERMTWIKLPFLWIMERFG